MQNATKTDCQTCGQSSNLKEKLRHSYPFVTFSAGAVTYEATPHSTVETIRIADELMYSVKASTKNGIRYFLYLG